MAAARGGSRLGLYGGLAAAGGIGYYMYQAGGSPKLAEKEFEREFPHVGCLDQNPG